MKKGSLVILDRDWASYTKGTRFTVVEVIPCNEVTGTDGKKSTPLNLRVVFEGLSIDDTFHHRTVPAEYTVDLPTVGASETLHANQGDRDATVLATLGSEVLYEYEMPNGRTYLRVVDVFTPGTYRTMSRNAMPKKWQKELAA